MSKLEEKWKISVPTTEYERKFREISEETIREYAEPVFKKLKEEIEKSKLKIIETLGIFVALFTFISVEFQTFRIYQDPKEISGLTLILLGALLFFILIFDLILNKENINPLVIIFMPVAVFMMIAGLFLFSFLY